MALPLLAEACPSEDRSHIRSWDVMELVSRVSLDIGGIRQALTLTYGRRIGHAFTAFANLLAH